MKKNVVYIFISIILILGLITNIAIFIINKNKEHHKLFKHTVFYDHQDSFYESGYIPFSGQGKLRIEKWKLDIPDGNLTPPTVILENNKFIVPTTDGAIYVGRLDNNIFKSKKIYQLSDNNLINNKFISSTVNLRDIKVNGQDIYVTLFGMNQNKCFCLKIYYGQLNNGTIKSMRPIWQSNSDCNHPPKISAGRLLILDKNHLLISTGKEDETLFDETHSDYGKTILLTMKDNKIIKKEIFTSGHRNPSGLFVHQKNPLEVYEVEHGPMGGDELNLLKLNNNYGWPHVTYGIPYSENNALNNNLKNSDTHFSSHEGFTKPLFSWMPDIGISDIIEIQSKKQLPYWYQDILIGSLNGVYGSGHSIYRLHLDNGRVNLVERIEINEKIRSLFEDSDGNIWFKTDSQKIGKLSLY